MPTAIALSLGKTPLPFSSTRSVLGKPAATMKPSQCNLYPRVVIDQRHSSRHREFRSWKWRLQRVEASYKRLGRDKRPEEKRTGTRDYKLEWEVYQEKKKEKERERLADALYVPSDDTVRIKRDDGSFRYIYKY